MMLGVFAAAWQHIAGRCFSGLLCLCLLMPGLAAAATYTSASTAYSLIDSSSHTKVGYNTAPYKFTAASGCGTAPPILDDTLSGLIPLGFTFVFGGTSYTGAYVQTNGRLQFANTTCGSGTASSGNPQTYPYGFPNASMNGVMKIFGVDLDHTNLVDKPNYPSSTKTTPCTSSASCYISVATIGTAPSRQFVVTWKNVPEWVAANNTSGSFDLQIILNEDGSFIYQYGAITHGGTGTAQIGWQLSTTDYQVLAFGASAEPPPNSAIIFYIPAPVASYQFEEGAWAPALAGQVVDASGKNRPGSSLGNAQPTATGKVCRALDIPANTSAASVDAVRTGVDLSSASLNMQGSGTIAFWYKSNVAWNSSGTDAQLVDAGTVNNEWFYLTRRANGTLVFGVTDSLGAFKSVSSPGQSFAAGTWVHVAVAWSYNGLAGSNQDNLRLFVNGVQVAINSFTSNGTITTRAGVVHLGDNPSGFADNTGTVNSANGQIDEAQFYNYVLSAAQLSTLMSASRTCTVSTFDHIEIQHATGSGLTCTPTVVTVRACQNAACTVPYTSGLAGSLRATGVSAVFDNSGNGNASSFVIPSGSSSVTKGVQVTTLGSAVLGINSVSVSATGTHTCNFGSPSCTLSAVDAGLLLSVPDHVSDSLSTLTVSAVKKSDNSLACVPAFANVTRAVNVKCSYNDPASGTLAVRVADTALNSGANPAAACDAGGRDVNLAFNASGVATPTLQFADVGRLGLSATYTGSAATTDTGLVMTGSTTFVAAPASFGLSGITVGPLRAGTAFSATVTARNANGVAAPNFGREASPESVTLSHQRRAPTGTGARDGVLGGGFGGFSAGSATATDLSWSEVGSIDLSVALASRSYLGSGLEASGSTGSAGAVGPFIPHHFDVTATAACGTFSYAGQPFAVTVTARNGLSPSTTTMNFDGSAGTAPNQAQSITLGEAAALGLGSWTGHAVPASAFIAGMASATPSYAFTSKATAPQSLTLRATNAGAGASAISSADHAEGSMALRSGRLRLSNAFGSVRAPLQLPVVAEYWSGNAWVLNSADSCTSLPGASVALSNPRSAAGGSTAASTSAAGITLTSGSGALALAAPSPAGSGLSLDIAINLGSTAADQSCHASHPATTGAAQPWLRAQNGSCAATADRDPAARASFGIFSPETRRTVHVREIF